MNTLKLTESWYNYFDIIAIFLWSLLLFKYWATGELYLLIHPNYFLLVFATSILLFILSIVKIILIIIKSKSKQNINTANDNQHTNLLPKGWASSLLILVAVLGLVIQPTVLSSQTALQRGVSDTLPPTTVETQSFLNQTPPEKRSLIEWVRTLNAYPEPDNYTGQKANITGFVVHLDNLPDNYIYLSRFVLTCCAVDAYPVGILVELPKSREEYPPDTWLEIQGVMKTETLPSLDASQQREKRQLVLKSQNIQVIPTPPNPYAY
ncbi:TIGR03943 family putative permease subunit [Geminocystis herdmanii]|uniref:TIGR03943 family putative permease subunit n=1 Tax=Geminocystis herdmanii TaxID=669359 RepID=UPI000349BC05|nr:TIGR03943 family protein [Geminocystis herdmanii]